MADVLIQIWDVLFNQFLKNHCRRRGGRGVEWSGVERTWNGHVSYNKYFELKNLWGADGVPQTQTTC